MTATYRLAGRRLEGEAETGLRRPYETVSRPEPSSAMRKTEARGSASGSALLWLPTRHVEAVAGARRDDVAGPVLVVAAAGQVRDFRPAPLEAPRGEAVAHHSIGVADEQVAADEHF